MLARAAPRKHALRSTCIGEAYFLPFLYYTRAIQRGYVDDRETRHDDAEENVRTSQQRQDGTKPYIPYIPFERPPRRPDPYAELELEGSTITPNERKAFEGLFALEKASSGSEKKAAPPRKITSESQPPKQKQKAHSDSSPSSALDSLLESAMNKLDVDGRRPSQLPAALRPIAEEARNTKKGKLLQATNDRQLAKERYEPLQIEDPNSEAAAISRFAKAELESVRRAMQRVHTDVEVWEILQERVFNRVAALELDAHPAGEKQKDKDIRSIRPKDVQILPTTLPIHLRHAMRHLTATFPTSSLPLAVLPYLKSLGPTACALGSSTEIYNQHMQLLYTRYLDLHGIVAVLEEMEREVYDFNEGTSDLLRQILRDARLARNGGKGEAVKALWSGMGMRKGVREVNKWLQLMSERRKDEAIRKAREKEEDTSLND